MILNPGNGSNTIKNEHVLKDGAIVPSAAEHVVLGTTIDSCLTCCFHLKQLCKKVANKLNDLTKLLHILDIAKDDSSTVPFSLDN